MTTQAAPVAENFVVGCTGKEKFTFDRARAVAHAMRRRAKGKKDRRVGFYHCPNCKGWHTGHDR